MKKGRSWKRPAASSALIVLLSGVASVFILSSNNQAEAVIGFDDTKILSTNSGASLDPSVSALGNNVYIAWSDKTPGNNEIILRASTDGDEIPPSSSSSSPPSNNSSNNDTTSSPPVGVTFFGDEEVVEGEEQQERQQQDVVEQEENEDVVVDDEVDVASDFNIAAVGDWGCKSETEDTVDNIISKSPEVVLGLGDAVSGKDADCCLK